MDSKLNIVEALNIANDNIELYNRVKVITAKKRILSILGKNYTESFKGEVGTDVLVSLISEAFYSFSTKKHAHLISYLTSITIPLIESEVAWAYLSSKVKKEDAKYLVNFINMVNNNKAKNLKLSINTKFNVINIMNSFDYHKLPARNPLKKLLAPKAWDKAAVKIAKDCRAIRPLIYDAIQKAAESDPDYDVTVSNSGIFKITKVKNLNHVKVNYMYKDPKLLTDINARNFVLNGSIYEQSAALALKSSYTFNEEYNNAIKKVIASGDHWNYFSAENSAALKAKVESVEVDVAQGLSFWNELGKGNVYFNYVIDFRGRISQLGGLSAVGHKTGKAMLRAGVKRSLGSNGLKHLLIALGSSMGHDKMTLADREQWAHDNLDTYITIGELVISNPVKAFQDLHDLDADDIFASASIALELYYISKFEGQIEDFKSNLFVGYDATCSGLQIVSLLWGNKMLAENTNVAKFEGTEDKIYDIYKYLYKAMDKIVWDGFDAKTEHGKELLQVWDALEIKTKRTIAKKLLMPRIYGSTSKTWRENTIKEAGKKDIFAHIVDDVERESMTYEFGNVIAKLFKTTFDKESGFQAFRDFDSVVGQVAKAYNNNELDTRWTTFEPSNFDNQVINFKYRKPKSTSYYVYRNGKKSYAASYQVSIFEDQLQKVSKVNLKIKNKSKAKNAISPNFVHSLDALLLHTVNYSMKTSMRLTHDCFACTPGEAEKMREVINHSYIDLFGGNNNFMKNLADETYENTGMVITIPDTLDAHGISEEAIKLGIYKFS